MGIKAVLFDLDGTLLPMDQDKFIKTYLGSLAEKMIPRGYNPKEFLSAMWAGTADMVKNDGSSTNENKFWKRFEKIYGQKYIEDLPYIDRFYVEDFDKVQAVCGYTPRSKELVDALKKEGICVALATNPLFPQIATHKRIAWAGLTPEDFAICTTYENARYSKPNPLYYADVAKAIGIAPEDCLMVGNDVSDDMTAAEIGMQVFLLTDCLINSHDVDISQYPNGDFDALYEYINAHKS